MSLCVCAQKESDFSYLLNFLTFNFEKESFHNAKDHKGAICCCVLPLILQHE